MTDTNWSVPETEVLFAIGDAVETGREAVLATIIDVDGSAYRRPGAKMLVESADGGTGGVGSLTAGCLEEEVRGLAADVRETGEPHIETYDLTGEDDVWGMGMGCNGVITVLLEPLAEYGTQYGPVVEAIEAGADRALVTVVGGDRPLCERARYDPASGFTGDLPDWLCDELRESVEATLADGAADSITVATDRGTVEVFVEGIEAPPELVVCGAGPDVGPVVDLAKRVNFRVTVVGFRGALATEERFPNADAVRASSPANVRDSVEFDADTCVVVMSHNFIDDRLALAELIETPVEYIGLMGPRKRFEEMCEDFAEEGVELADDDLRRVYTPIGLDLGGDSPYRIAYSIVGEALAVANDRDGGHLTERGGPIHDRIDLDAPSG